MRLTERKAWISMLKDLGVKVNEDWKHEKGIGNTCTITITDNFGGNPYIIHVRNGNTTIPKKRD